MSECFGVNGQGHLTIGGADTVALAKEYGTPLYVMDEMGIRGRCRQFMQSMQEFYGGRGMVLYASKAFSCKEIYRIMDSEGVGVDVVSAGELFTALSAGFPAGRIYFHGNNKTDEELKLAVSAGVGHIVADNLYELERLEALLEREGKSQKVLLRVKPGVDAHTHKFITTGQIDSKFGFALETGEAMAAVHETLKLPRIELDGLHCHIGSQIFDTEPFCLAAELMAGLLGEIKQACGIELPTLNLGGGFGIRYVTAHDPAPYESYMEKVAKTLKEACGKNGIAQPYVLIEPGRSIVGDAGLTLYTVGAVKEIPKIRTYMAVDGGMADNPRYALYHSEYEAVSAAHVKEPKLQKVTLAGKCCESGDLLGEDMLIQTCLPGEILAVMCTGAYNFSMASNYNRIPRPAVVMVREGQSRVIVRRESLEDLVRNDL